MKNPIQDPASSAVVGVESEERRGEGKLFQAMSRSFEGTAKYSRNSRSPQGWIAQRNQLLFGKEELRRLAARVERYTRDRRTKRRRG